MNLSPDFSEFIELLNEHEVEYLIVGGYAVILHGYPRYTGDMDFYIKKSKADENGKANIYLIIRLPDGGRKQI
jgi:hypothetical protein